MRWSRRPPTRLSPRAMMLPHTSLFCRSSLVIPVGLCVWSSIRRCFPQAVERVMVELLRLVSACLPAQVTRYEHLRSRMQVSALTHHIRTRQLDG